MDAISEKVVVGNKAGDNILQYSFKISGLGDIDTTTGKGKASISGTMINSITFQGGNQFSTSGEMVREAPLISTAFKQVVSTKIEDFTNKRGQRMLGGYGKFNKGETRSKWTESTRPQFACEFSLLANTANDAITNIATVNLIKSATLPINDGGALLAPLRYKGREAGTLTFSLGTWLVVPKLIMVNENCTPSLQVMSNGYPLYWHCVVTMEPFETITIDEFQRYFQQPAILYTPAGQTQAVNDNSISGIAGKLRSGLGLDKYNVG